MSPAAADEERSGGVDPGDGAESMAGPGNSLAGPAVTGFTMLGTRGAEMCDEDGVCEVPSPGTPQINADLGLDGG